MSVKPIQLVKAINSSNSPESERPAPVLTAVLKAENKPNPEQVKVNKEDLQSIAEIMTEVSKTINCMLNFEVYEDTDEVYVQIVDSRTREVIKQIPPEEMLELSAKIKEMVGIILDKYI